MANLHAHVVRAQVSLSLFTEFGEDGFRPQERRAEELKSVLNQVVELAGKLRG